MAGKTYSAGTIFLQVVPVFGDVQNAIRRQARDLNTSLGDEMEKGGAEAGQRASKAINEELERGSREGGRRAGLAFEKELKKSLDDIDKSLTPIKPQFEDNDVRRSITALRKSLKDLREEADKGLNPKRYREVGRELEAIRAHAHALQGDMSELQKHDFANVTRGLDRVLDRMHSVRKAAEIEFRLDTKQAERALGAYEKKARQAAKNAAAAIGDSTDPELRKLKKRFDDLGEMEIGVDIRDEDFHRKMKELETELRAFKYRTVSAEAKLDAGAALAKIAEVNIAADRIDGRKLTMNVDVDSGAAAAKLGLLRGLFQGNGADSAANSFRSFNAIVLAAVTLLPALVPIIGAVGGALLGLGPILAGVGSGLGAMLVGFSGLGGALTALGNQADHAAYDTSQASKTMQAASYAVADAQQALGDAVRSSAQAQADAARQVADARRAAAQAIQDAIRRQQDAQEAYRDSVKDVQQAEEDLREARKRAAEQAKYDAADNKDKRRQNALDIREASLAAFDATNTYNAVMADGSSTAYDKEAAQVAMLQAQERLHELRDTQAELAKEHKQQAKDGVNDNADVQAAQDALTAALDAQKKAQEAVGDAARAVARARIEGARRVADAVRQQQRTEADGARSVARAQEALRRSQEAYGQALFDTGEIGSASARQVEAAMSKLGPAGRKFAYFLFGLRDTFYAFRDSIQEAMLPGVQRAIEGIISKYGPRFTAFMATMGGVVGNFFEQLSASLQGPAWGRFFAVMDRLGPKMAAQFGKSTINWLEVFANIMVAVAPFAERMSLAMLKMSEAVRRWSASKRGSDAVTGFMEYARDLGGPVLAFLGAFIRAAINLGRAIAPWGKLVLEGLTKILNWIANMDPKTLGLITSAILSMVIAWQAAVGATAAFYGGLSAFQTVGGRFIFTIFGVAGALAIMALRSEKVRDKLADLFGWVSDHVGTLAKIASVVLSIVAAYKAYVFIAGIVKGVQMALLAIQSGMAAAYIATDGAIAANVIAMKLYAAVSKIQAIWTGIVTAAQWAMNAALLANPYTWVVIAIIALVAAIIVLWKKNETFRRVITAAWNYIKEAAEVAWGAIVDAFWWLVDASKDVWNATKPFFVKLGAAFKWLWQKAIKPALKFIVAYWKFAFKVMKAIWQNVLWPVLDLLIHIVTKLWSKVFKPYLTFIFNAWRNAFKIMKWAWETLLKPAIKYLGDAISKLWHNVFDPAMTALEKLWRGFSRAFSWVYDHAIKPIIDAFIKLMGGRDGLQSKFETVVSAIKTIWEGLKKVFAAPIKFLLETVLNNGVIAGFNKIANFVGSTPIKEIPIPKGIDDAYATGGVYGRRKKGYATGGTLPGYTPGQDVHHFVSPTAGRLDLSGGEAIMRPEFTAAVGPQWVDKMNAIARAEGVNGVRRQVKGRGYWMGGVLPLFGARVDPHESGYPFYAADLNYGSGYDDYGMPIHAWKAGIAQGFDFGRDYSYGRGVAVNHGAQTSVYAHMSNVVDAILGGYVKAGQTIGFVGDYGNTGNPPTSHLHFEIRPGGFPSLPYTGDVSSTNGGKQVGGGVPHFPGWLMSVAKNPLGYVQNLISGPISNLKDRFGNNGMVKMISSIPGKLVGGLKDKIVDMLPGSLGSIVNGAGDVVSGVGDAVGGLGDAIGLYRGGILPYNGTMMYDSGGYLPPGITQVVNMTGRPEPVLTRDQFDGMNGAGRAPLVGTYAPVFQGADLDASDVMDEFEFSIRKLSRTGGGKYEGVQS